MMRGYSRVAERAANSSYSKAWNVPDCNEPPMPHSTKPSAKPAYEGKMVQTAKPDAVISAPNTSSPRRETVSAQAPDGTSKTNAVTDQMNSSDEISAVSSPWSAKSSAYSA